LSQVWDMWGKSASSGLAFEIHKALILLRRFALHQEQCCVSTLPLRVS